MCFCPPFVHNTQSTPLQKCALNRKHWLFVCFALSPVRAFGPKPFWPPHASPLPSHQLEIGNHRQFGVGLRIHAGRKDKYIFFILVWTALNKFKWFQIRSKSKQTFCCCKAEEYQRSRRTQPWREKQSMKRIINKWPIDNYSKYLKSDKVKISPKWFAQNESSFYHHHRREYIFASKKEISRSGNHNLCKSSNNLKWIQI